MESLPQIKETLSQYDVLSPDALRGAFGLPGSPAAASDVSDFFAVAFQPRERDPMELDGGCLKIDWASCYIPHHDDDAHFGLTDAGVVGVADGVGGWRHRGVDAAAFSRALMTSAFAEALAHEPRRPVVPYTLLERAYAETAASGTPASSTACIVSVFDKTLKWANIGDSAFAVLRDGKIVYRSQVQQSYFNSPLQLATNGGDSITRAAVGEMPVKEGDVVVVGTDGLFDNMFDHELERAVQIGMALGFSPQNTADILAGLAYEMSMATTRESPFTVARREREDQSKCHAGGKKDDITVIVAFVVWENS